MRPGSLYFIYLPLLIYCICAGGCMGRSAAIHEYTLTPARTFIQHPSLNTQSILLMPVRLPPQSDATGIVTRTGQTTITTSSTNLWAGDLSRQLTSTLAENIRNISKEVTVVLYPPPRYFTPEHTIDIDLQRFDGRLGHNFTCTAAWTISDNRQETPLAQKKFTTTVAVKGTTYAEYVQAASTALGLLSEDIHISLHKMRSVP